MISLAVSKTFILTSSQEHIDWMVEDATIEEVLVAKYLGVDPDQGTQHGRQLRSKHP